MNPPLVALAFTAAGCLYCLAQDAAPAPAAPDQPDPVVEAIKKKLAARPGDRRPNEVVVDLPPPPPAEPAPPSDNAKDATAPAPGPPTAADPSPPAEPAPGLTVQVEKLQTGKGTVDPSTVKLLAPFPAKPLAAIPPGWRLDASSNAPPFIRSVDLAPGSSITLTIRPHLLVPDAASVAIAEPGFTPTLGYRQAQTVSAILASSIQQLDEDAKQLGYAIDHLQQLVSSLPRPEPKPQPPSTPTQPNKR